MDPGAFPNGTRHRSKVAGRPPPAKAERSEGRPPSLGVAPRPPCKEGEDEREWDSGNPEG